MGRDNQSGSSLSVIRGKDNVLADSLSRLSQVQGSDGLSSGA